ncbi:P1 family peptidase [Microlunatus sp. Gsoil 973]|uniref:P1 family peptidase n=1 Tax=Microlunatus sp. Gsoil 973 TaxID=2672569 RepID=UPI0012B460C5|nr:P1 family peptidase [Microlunatus sp. Gsoil 973]QGN32624.1 peptidase S58 family protein [Microlunatus sp. Gsoil 973]
MDFAVHGVRVGHWSDPVGETGCTVIELPAGSAASYEARGGAPASRELELLEPDKAVTSVDAVLLTGGSAFGLGAADGVMRYYEERGRGVPTPGGNVPIVPTLALFDLGVGDSRARPDPDSGYAAAAATKAEQILRGRVGAGSGAYVGHWRGPDGRRPGGLGYSEQRLDDGGRELVVAAMCVVNAFGDIDHGGGPISFEAVRDLHKVFEFEQGRSHTTIGVVVTNARLDKTGCRILAQGGHDGIARSLTPPHTRFDGDAIIAAATGEMETPIDVVRMMAVAAVAEAVRSVDAA